MFRGLYQPSPPKFCKHCKGSGKVSDWNGLWDIPCTSCNSTGLHGEPFWAFMLIIAVAIATTVVPLIWWFL